MGDEVLSAIGNIGGTIGKFTVQVSVNFNTVGENAGKLTVSGSYGILAGRGGANFTDGTWSVTDGMQISDPFE